LPTWIWLLALAGITITLWKLQINQPPEPQRELKLPPWTLADLQKLKQQNQESWATLLKMTEDLFVWKFGPRRHWSPAQIEIWVNQAGITDPAPGQVAALWLQSQASLYGNQQVQLPKIDEFITLLEQAHRVITIASPNLLAVS